MCWMCFKNTQWCHTASYSHWNNFFQAKNCCALFQYMACCRQVKHANTFNICSRRVDFVFLFSLISTCFLLPIKHTLEVSSVTTHQETCPSPTLCDIFIATSSNAGSPLQGSAGWRSQGDGSICHFQRAQATCSVPGNPRASVSQVSYRKLCQITCSKKLKNVDQGQILRPIIQANSF